MSNLWQRSMYDHMFAKSTLNSKSLKIKAKQEVEFLVSILDLPDGAIVPRGISVNAGGDAEQDSTEFVVSAILGSNTYGICSNKFLDEEFQTVRYDVKFELIDEDTFSYDENTQIKIKGQPRIFDHIERNVLKRVK
jgi:hypothetical protein